MMITTHTRARARTHAHTHIRNVLVAGCLHPSDILLTVARSVAFKSVSIFNTSLRHSLRYVQGHVLAELHKHGL
jgi:hypothetical protein